MSVLLANWRKSLLGLLVAFTAVTLWQDARQRVKGAAPAFDADDVRLVCEGSRYPEDFFWERARTMGVVGGLLVPEGVERYAATGEILRFTRKEIEKLRQTGVAVSAAPLKPGALWVKSDRLRKRLEASAAAARSEIRVQRYGDSYVVESDLPAGAPSLGYDPEAMARLRAAGLIPVYSIGSLRDLRLAMAEEGSSVYLIDAQFDIPDEDKKVLAEALSRPGRWLASSGRFHLPYKALTARAIGASAGLPGFLRVSSHEGARLVVLGLDRGLSVEKNLHRVRALLRALRAAGYAQRLPKGAGRREISGVEAGVRFVLGFFITVLGPILALRQGLSVLRGLRRIQRVPQASPLLEVFLATGTTAATCAVVGLAAYASFLNASGRAGGAAWELAVGGLTMLTASAALYLPEGEAFMRLRHRKIHRAVGRGAAAAALIAFILISPQWFERFGPPAWLDAFSLRQPGWWWASARWREIFIGYPCLVLGFFLYYRRLDDLQRGRRDILSVSFADPRLWLMIGMFAPVGLAQALSRVETPYQMTLQQSMHCLAGGLVLGLFGVGVYELLRTRLKVSGK